LGQLLPIDKPKAIETHRSESSTHQSDHIMSQSTTPVKQAKPAAAAGSEKDPVRMLEKLETKTKAVYVLSLPSHMIQTAARGDRQIEIWMRPDDQ